MAYTIAVDNIKCGGCAASIRHRLLGDALVDAVEVDIEQGEVRILGDDSAREQVARTLARMGYPVAGSVEGLKSAAAKAKSFVSCAVGKMGKAGTTDC